MDYLDWCHRLLKAIADAYERNEVPLATGMDADALADQLYGPNSRTAATWRASTEYRGLIGTLQDLAEFWLLEHFDADSYKLARAGRLYLQDPVAAWEPWCSTMLEDGHVQVLHAVLALGVDDYGTHLFPHAVYKEQLLAWLTWPETAAERLWAIIGELRDLGFLKVDSSYGSLMFAVSPTIPGAIWATKRGYVAESRCIDALIMEWETTSVDFKREQHTDTKDQKAELIKDLLGLATTQASGPRYMIIGFDDKTRAYYGPPDKKIAQNHLEQLAAAYTEPVLDLTYTVIDYRDGPVGRIKIQRDPKKIPYRVRQDLAGEKRKISAGDIYVRHGSQTEPPTEAERAALIEEGERARGEAAP